MKNLLLSFAVLMSASAAHAAPTGCYSLYMRPETQDPGRVCLEYRQTESGQTYLATASLWRTSGAEPVEVIQLQVTSRFNPVVRGHSAGTFYFYNGSGRLHSVKVDSAGPAYPIDLLVKSSADGHVQRTVEFSRVVKRPKQSCGGRMCK